MVTSPFIKVDTVSLPVEALVKIANIWARPKAGKTHTALTWPEPIYFFDFDLGSDEVLVKFAGKKEIYRKQFIPRIPEKTVGEAEYLLNQFEESYRWALQNIKSGTVVVDTGSALWGGLVSPVLIDRRLRKRSDQTPYPFDYGDANTYFENLVNMVRATSLNLVLCHRAREKYIGKDPSGDFEAQSNNKVDYFVQVGLRLEARGKETQRIRPQDTKPAWKIAVEQMTGSYRPIAVIDVCRSFPEFEGQILLEPSYQGLVEFMKV